MVQLMEHQKTAIQKLDNGKILWGDVGTGKSLTALAYFYVRECGGTIDAYDSIKTPMNIYVITTAKKRDSKDWEKDAAKLGLSWTDDYGAGGILLTVDSWNNIKKYTEVEDAFFVFDEQRVVGSGAWTKSFYKIAKRNRWILLTATPGDTWLDYVPVFVANGFYKNRTEFIREHVVYNTFAKFPKVDRYIATGRLIKHRNELLVHMPYPRHTTRTYETLECDYDKAKFEKVVKHRWNVFEDKPVKDVAELFRVMRKVVNSDASRLDRVRTLMNQHPKLIVFYSHNYELELLRAINMESGSPAESASQETSLSSSSSKPSASNSVTTSESGSTTSFAMGEWNGHKHEPIPKSDRWLYLVQYTAGSEGWNCTETDAMAFFSLTYSYKQFYQAQGRIDRLNTKFTDLKYYILRSNSMIDRAIWKSLSNKKNFNERDIMPNQGKAA
jgi:hypothetical protein